MNSWLQTSISSAGFIQFCQKLFFGCCKAARAEIMSPKNAAEGKILETFTHREKLLIKWFLFYSQLYLVRLWYIPAIWLFNMCLHALPNDLKGFFKPSRPPPLQPKLTKVYLRSFEVQGNLVSNCTYRWSE